MQVVPGVVRLAVNVATDDDRCEHRLDIVLLDDNLLLTVGIGWDVFTNIYPETSIYARVKNVLCLGLVLAEGSEVIIALRCE